MSWRYEIRDQMKNDVLCLAFQCVLSDSTHLLFVPPECVCAHMCVCMLNHEKALKRVALDRLLFVFSAQDQSQVALKLAWSGLHCMSALSKDPEEPARSLMLIQKPDFPLLNTISQVRAVSASMKLIPTVSLCSSTVNTNVMILASSC